MTLGPLRESRIISPSLLSLIIPAESSYHKNLPNSFQGRGPGHLSGLILEPTTAVSIMSEITDEEGTPRNSLLF